MVNPDGSWLVCRIYRKKKRMPRVTTQARNSLARSTRSLIAWLKLDSQLELANEPSWAAGSQYVNEPSYNEPIHNEPSWL
nr:unnamed protein product [Digitaria exilis]